MLTFALRITRILFWTLLAVGALLILTTPAAHAATEDPAAAAVIDIPAVPAGVIVLIGFFSPYAIAALNGILPFVQKTWQKRIVSIVVSVALAAVVMVFFYTMTSEPVPAWPVFILLSIAITQLSYGLVTRSSATAVEQLTSTPSRVDGAHNVEG